VVRYTTHSGSGKKRKSHHHTAYGHHSFMSLNFKLNTYTGGNSSKGMYKYPYSFTIPFGSPGTINHNESYRIIYGCAAKLSRPSVMSWDVICDAPFSVIPNACNPAFTFPIIIDPQFVSSILNIN
jgi:hypothetical protein